MNMAQGTKSFAIGAAVVVAGISAVVTMAVWTAPTRDALRCYTQMLGAANAEDVEAVRRICSTRYVANHTLKVAPEGGIVGFPRNIHKNFKAWRSGPNVWLCATNRVGPVYQFVKEAGSWRFDGPIGTLNPGNVFTAFVDEGAADSAEH